MKIITDSFVYKAINYNFGQVIAFIMFNNGSV